MLCYRRLWFSVVAIASLWLLGPVPVTARSRSGRRLLTPSAAASLPLAPYPNSNPVRKNHNHHHQKQYSSRRFKSPKKNKMECEPELKSIWLMNQCHHGYVAVLPDRRVVSLDTNNPHNNLGKKLWNVSSEQNILKNRVIFFLWILFMVYFFRKYKKCINRVCNFLQIFILFIRKLKIWQMWDWKFNVFHKWLKKIQLNMYYTFKNS